MEQVTKSFYSGREAPSLKMGSVCFSYYYFYYFYYYFYFGGGSTSGLMLIGSRPPRDRFDFFEFFEFFHALFNGGFDCLVGLVRFQ